MPRYFFHAISGDVRQPDDVGRELPGDQSAFDHAVSGLQALFAAPFGKQIRPGTYSVEVVTADGRVLFTVPMDLPIVQQVGVG